MIGLLRWASGIGAFLVFIYLPLSLYTTFSLTQKQWEAQTHARTYAAQLGLLAPRPVRASLFGMLSGDMALDDCH